MATNGRFFDPLSVAVAGGKSVVDAASVAGCSVRTAYRLSSSAAFQRRVSELRTAAVAGAVGQLAAAAQEAVATMQQLLGSDDDSVRLRAAVAILDRFVRLSESVDLRARVEALEQQAARGDA